MAGNWSRDLGGDRSSGRLPCPVQGLSSSPSSHTVSFPTYRAGSPRAQALRQEVEAMLAKGALEIARDPGPGFYSRLFLVEKATGGWRPVIDLSHLNDFVQLTPFKMETVASVLLSVGEGDFLASLDLKDAYFQIPIHGSSRKLLRFMSEGTVYQFKALCFGLSTAPQVFTRVFAAVSAWAHSRDQTGLSTLRWREHYFVRGAICQSTCLRPASTRSCPCIARLSWIPRPSSRMRFAILGTAWICTRSLPFLWSVG